GAVHSPHRGGAASRQVFGLRTRRALYDSRSERYVDSWRGKPDCGACETLGASCDCCARTVMKHLSPLLALLSVACTGILDGQYDSGQSSPNPSPNQATGGAGGSAPSTPMTEPAGDPFKVRNTEPELVPFEMRLRRI